MAESARSVSDSLTPVVPREPLALRWRYAAAATLFFVVYRVLGLRRGVIHHNLERSFPQFDVARRAEVARDFVRRQSQVFAEID
jgi:lauroyl/myristoyl acyltransferase